MSKTNKSALNVKCPTCKKGVTWNDNSPYRPFCSDRCQKIDLGAWANESYTIPVENAEEWSGAQAEALTQSNTTLH